MNMISVFNLSMIDCRDVKPHNVMLKADGTPVLMDFGSMGYARHEVKNASEATALQDLAAERCSMAYRAPELFSVQTHDVIDEKVDIWVCVSFSPMPRPSLAVVWLLTVKH
jgi:serine/threonine kinase 16